MPNAEPGRFFADKNVVITGGSSGLGRQIVEALQGCGPNMIVVTRARSSPPVSGAGIDIDSVYADLASMEQVIAASREIRSSWNRVDILINNAGSLDLKGQMTPEGLERNLAVNYLSHYVLTAAILDLLERSPAALVLNVGSAAADRRKGCGFDDFFRKPASPRAAYERSKWAISAFSFALADAFRERGMTARSILLRPPFMDTGIIRNNASGSLRSRVGLRILEAVGAFTDCNRVAGAALDLVQRDGAATDYAVWSRKENGFAWADRPKWSEDEAATAQLLDASEAACSRVLGTAAAELRTLRRSSPEPAERASRF